MAPLSTTRGHIYKLFKNRCYATIRSNFFGQRIVNSWSNLPGSVDFSFLSSFVRNVKLAGLSDLKCFFYRNEFCTSEGYQCFQSYVVCVFTYANVRAGCAFLSCSYALLLYLLEVFNEQINDDDDDDDDDCYHQNIGVFFVIVLHEWRTSAAASATNGVQRLQSLADGGTKLFLVSEGVCMHLGYVFV